eukprot:gene23640-63980_t
MMLLSARRPAECGAAPGALCTAFVAAEYRVDGAD